MRPSWMRLCPKVVKVDVALNDTVWGDLRASPPEGARSSMVDTRPLKAWMMNGNRRVHIRCLMCCGRLHERRKTDSRRGCCCGSQRHWGSGLRVSGSRFLHTCSSLPNILTHHFPVVAASDEQFAKRWASQSSPLTDSLPWHNFPACLVCRNKKKHPSLQEKRNIEQAHKKYIYICTKRSGGPSAPSRP